MLSEYCVIQSHHSSVLQFRISALFFLVASSQFFYSSNMSIGFVLRALRELTGGFNYSWLSGRKNYTRPQMISLVRAVGRWRQPSDRPSTSTRVREIETVSREIPIDTYTEAEYERILFPFFFPSTYASVLSGKMIFASEKCVFVFALETRVARRSIPLHLYFSSVCLIR